MQINELKENEPLKVTEVYYRLPMPDSLLRSHQIEPYEIVNKHVYEVIFTDGDIDKKVHKNQKILMNIILMERSIHIVLVF